LNRTSFEKLQGKTPGTKARGKGAKRGDGGNEKTEVNKGGIKKGLEMRGNGIRGRESPAWGASRGAGGFFEKKRRTEHCLTGPDCWGWRGV